MTITLGKQLSTTISSVYHSRHLILISRIKGSWKDEYLAREKIGQYWSRPATRVIIDARYSIDCLDVTSTIDYASLQSGVISSISKIGETIRVETVFENEQTISICVFEQFLLLIREITIVGCIDGQILCAKRNHSGWGNWILVGRHHLASITALCLAKTAHTSNYIISGGSDGSVKLWNFNIGSITETSLSLSLAGASGPIIKLYQHSNTAVAQSNNDVFIWNLPEDLDTNLIEGCIFQTQIHFEYPIKNLFYAKQRLVVHCKSGENSKLSVWKTNGDPSCETLNFRNPITEIQCYFDQELDSIPVLVVGDCQGTVYIYTLPDMNLLRILRDHVTAVCCILVTQEIVAVSANSIIHLYDSVNFDPITALHADFGHVIKFLGMNCGHIVSATDSIVTVFTQRLPKGKKIKKSKTNVSIGMKRGIHRSDILLEVNETINLLDSSSSRLEDAKKRVANANGLIMSDPELLEYAMILSAGNSATASNFVGIEDADEEEMIQLAIAMSLSESMRQRD